MKADNVELNKLYRSRVNVLATGCKYEVIKKNKTSCWVRLWENGKITDTIYKNVRYSVLSN